MVGPQKYILDMLLFVLRYYVLASEQWRDRAGASAPLCCCLVSGIRHLKTRGCYWGFSNILFSRRLPFQKDGLKKNRPISNISVISKILGKVVASRFRSHIDSNHLSNVSIQIIPSYGNCSPYSAQLHYTLD